MDSLARTARAFFAESWQQSSRQPYSQHFAKSALSAPIIALNASAWSSDSPRSDAQSPSRSSFRVADASSGLRSVSQTSVGATSFHASAGTAAAACSTAKVLTFDSLDANSSWAAAKSGKRAMLLGGVNLETTPETRSIIRMGRS